LGLRYFGNGFIDGTVTFNYERRVVGSNLFIPTMQAILPSKRTHLLDPTTYDDQQWIPWFSDNPLPSALPAILPLGRLVSTAGFRRAASFLPAGRSPFLYAKVGWQDAFAFPDLAPGSIVRANPELAATASARHARSLAR